MAKGQVSKAQITNKLLEIFDGAFLYNDGKEIRIPMIEDGNEVQIKVALTCAKDNVSQGADVALPGSTDTTVVSTATVATTPVETTQEEKDNIKKMMAALGL